MGKFNTFVKEKQLKVERGIRTEQSEKLNRECMDKEIVRKEELLGELTKAKVINKIIKQNLLKEVKEVLFPWDLLAKFESFSVMHLN